MPARSGLPNTSLFAIFAPLPSYFLRQGMGHNLPIARIFDGGIHAQKVLAVSYSTTPDPAAVDAHLFGRGGVKWTTHDFSGNSEL